MVFADKEYASAQNRIELKKGNLTDGIMCKAVKGKELTESEKLMNRVISGLRGKVEKGFGTLKRDYGFSRTRCIGCAKVKLEFLLTTMAFNLKKAALMVRVVRRGDKRRLNTVRSAPKRQLKGYSF